MQERLQSVSLVGADTKATGGRSAVLE